MWADRGLRMPEAAAVVSPKNAKEVSAVLKIANYYKIPVTTWGGGGGTQGQGHDLQHKTGDFHGKSLLTENGVFSLHEAAEKYNPK